MQYFVGYSTTETPERFRASSINGYHVFVPPAFKETVKRLERSPRIKEVDIAMRPRANKAVELLSPTASKPRTDAILIQFLDN